MFKRFFLFLVFIPSLIEAQSSFISGNETICDNASPAVVKIDFSGIAPFSFVYEINGVSQNIINTNINPYLIYTKEAGLYTLSSFSDFSGPGSIAGQAMLVVYQAPTSIIHTISDTITILDPSITFHSNSLGNIVQQLWNFGDNSGNSLVNNPIHTFPVDSNGLGVLGLYQSTLIVEDNNGCLDTSIKHIWVKDEYWIYIPNSFTPDLDGNNDLFCLEYHSIRENTFLFKVYNRQGDLMYQTSDPQELSCSNDRGWNGYHMYSDQLLSKGIYLYEVYFQDFEGWKHRDFGYITLMR